MTDETYQPKVYKSEGGNKLTVASGGEIRVESGGAFRVDGSQAKFFNRDAGTTDAFCVQVKSEPCSPSVLHAMIEGTCDWEPSSAATGGGVRAVQGVSRLQASKEMGAGSMVGVYGQVANVGTINGAGAMVSALYGLIEAGGGTYTALSHLSACWLDSHLTETVTAGIKDFLYISNNGSTTFDNAIYVYGGNKITNLFNLNTVSEMVADGGAGTPGGTVKKIKVVIDGVDYYLVASTTVS